MTNLGGPGFFFLVFGLLILAGTPFVVGAWLALLHYLDLGVVRTFVYVNGAMLTLGLVLVVVWSMPLIIEEFTADSLTYLGIYVGTALGIIVLVEILPLGIGILSTERFAHAERRAAAYASAGGWFVGSVLGIVVAALVSPGFLAALGAIPGGLVGAAVGGPVLYEQFGGRDPSA